MTRKHQSRDQNLQRGDLIWHIRFPLPMAGAVQRIAMAEERTRASAIRVLVNEALVRRGVEPVARPGST